MQDVREDARRVKNGTYSLTWKGEDGLSYSADGRGMDISRSGVGLECSRHIEPDTVVRIESRDSSVNGECVVMHCTRKGTKYHIGLEFNESAKGPARGQTSTASRVQPERKPETETDYYDVLQISAKADMETVHRVFRIMAARFHPDNPETGNVEEFLRLKRAYGVLSNPELRLEYDTLRQSREAGPMPIFELKDFVTGVEAESNRRLGVLSLLYNQRRTDPDHPGISLLDLETRMAFPREYLNFTMWYLRSKEFVVAADNSDYALTAAGVDFVEMNASESDILSRLLKPGSGSAPYRPKGSERKSEKLMLEAPPLERRAK